MERTDAQFDQVQRLLESGQSTRSVARELGIPQGTVQRLGHRSEPPRTVARHVARSAWAITDADRYCYLLGAYLGDGTICHQAPDHWSMRIVNDRRYPGISDEILNAMRITFTGSTARMWASWVGESDVLHIAHPAIPRAFPQHGPGRRHTRPIVLADWQRQLTGEHSGALVRGLIHSDGCRTTNRVRTKLPSGRDARYEYVRYFFTHHSADIRGIFVEHCELLGIRVTQSNRRDLSVSHRAGVAILEEVVGPKR